MFVCTIELLHPSRDRKELKTWEVNKLNSDPGFGKGEILEINNWNVGVNGERHTFNVMVVERKQEIHPAHKDLHYVHGYPEETMENGLFMLRIFVEAEDRDKLIEITEAIERLNPE